MSRSRPAAAVGLIGTLALAAFARPCCDQTTPTAGVGGSLQRDGGLDAAGSSAGYGGSQHAGGSGGGLDGSGGTAEGGLEAATCPTATPPSAVPPGWQELVGHACDCRFYIPGSQGQMPPPIEWESCPPESPQGVVCRIMKTTAAGVPFFYPAGVKLAPNSGGVPLIMFGRNKIGGDPNTRLRLIAEADGAVRAAFLQTGTSAQACALIGEGFAEGRYVYGIARNGPNGQGMLAGSLDSPHPSVVQKIPDGHPEDFDVSSQWLLQKTLGPYSVFTWDMQTTATVYDPSKDPDGLPAHTSQLVQGDVFFDVSAGGMSGTMSWNKSAGLRPLLRWYGDWDKASGDFGTDGKDMVWTYGEGKLAGLYEFSKLSVMTAPYTTDPVEAQAKAKRLRANPNTFYVRGYQVGCGHAARPATNQQGGNVLMIVRLSDGVAWMLAGTDPMTYTMEPVGLTCDEVFFADPLNRVVRVRIDSLGPGLAPD